MNLIAFRIESRIKLSSLISAFILIFLFAKIVLPASAATIEASREISAETVYPGENFAVIVHISTDQNVEALTLDENLPSGWQVSQLENNGAAFQETSTFKESTLEWIWVDNLSAGEKKTVVYNVVVPLNSEPGSFRVSGRVSAYSIPAASVKEYSEVIVNYPQTEANFSATPLLGLAPLIVQFTDLSTPNPDSWDWDFNGDGIIDSNERNPVYTYENPGTYNVTLKATNSTYGDSTWTKIGYITVTENLSSSVESGESDGSNGGSGNSRGSGSGGGGGGASSPESIKNIELKEIANEHVFKGVHTCFTFKDGDNEIVTVEFSPKKNLGKITAIVEILKNTSSIVKEPAPGIVYRNVNLWIGNSAFSSLGNFENAQINFRMKKTWITEKGVSENTIALYRYSEGKWSQLPTTLIREDKVYFYFTAETPGFSPFAISSTEKNTKMIEITPIKDKESTLISTEETFKRESEDDSASDKEIEDKDIPGSGISFVAVGFLASYSALKKRKVKYFLETEEGSLKPYFLLQTVRQFNFRIKRAKWRTFKPFKLKRK